MSAISAPLCKLCFIEHWSTQPHVFPELKKPKPPAPVVVPAAKTKAKKRKAKKRKKAKRRKA